MKIRELRKKLKNLDKAELVEVMVQMYKVVPKTVIEDKSIDDLIEDRELYLETRHREREAERELQQAFQEDNVASIAALQKWKALPEYGRNLILKNVWCTQCGEVRWLKQYIVESAGPDIVLRGNCPVCSHEVARHVEIQ